MEAKIKKDKNGVILGTVLDDQGLPLPGVNIIIQGTAKGTQTDFDGYFAIEVEKGDVLKFTYVGFESKKYEANKTPAIINLKQGNYLNDVVVSAYASKPSVGLIQESDDEANDFNYYRGNVYKRNSQPLASTNQTLQGRAGDVTIRGRSSINGAVDPLYVIDGVIVTGEEFKELSSDNFSSINILKDASATALYGSRAANGVIIITTKAGAAEEELQQIETRTNLKETAFFFPQLKTNEKGEVIFEFESPEALTRWNFQAFAHDKNLHQVKLDLTTVTQKDLNIIPNFPRFFRSKDTVFISAKVNNLSKNILN
jgi:TonB-dependent SusC/RagA subfamily outer membrane receptor